VDDLRKPSTLNPEEGLQHILAQLQTVAAQLQKMAAMPLSVDQLTVFERIKTLQACSKVLRTKGLGTHDKQSIVANLEKMLALPCADLESASPAQKMKLAKAEMQLAELKAGKTVRIQ
jgi:hypothetical protein